MPTETIDSKELDALRQQAAEAIPYKSEATRLARALWEEDQRHPVIVGELWNPLIEQWDAQLLAAQDPEAHATMGGVVAEPQSVSEALNG
jgi:hypothetical protein